MADFLLEFRSGRSVTGGSGYYQNYRELYDHHRRLFSSEPEINVTRRFIVNSRRGVLETVVRFPTAYRDTRRVLRQVLARHFAEFSSERDPQFEISVT